jgi:Na+-transporting methylmalonyl-CoA/oxaloacetate decarboxylase gamma subunit
MNENVPELLRQGLIITAIGMTLVFAVLGLLWGIMALLTRVFREAPEADLPQGGEASVGFAQVVVLSEASNFEALTVERARVAAIVAGALMANAVPLLMEAPVGPVFEHGRTAPIWVSANRARALQSWQPPRAAETPQQASSD